MTTHQCCPCVVARQAHDDQQAAAVRCLIAAVKAGRAREEELRRRLRFVVRQRIAEIEAGEAG